MCIRDRFRPVVVSLEDTVGNIAGEFTRLGIPVHCLKMRGVGSVPGGIVALTRLIREIRPDVVNTWLYHADLIGGLCARLAGCRAVSWNIRNGTLSPATSARTTRAVLWLNARLSSLIPAEILCCSEDARRIHVALGYDAGRIEPRLGVRQRQHDRIRDQLRARARGMGLDPLPALVR